MAATWEIDSINFDNRARREVRCVATRTDGELSRTYTVARFHVREGVPLADERDRLVAKFLSAAQNDASWIVPEFVEMFPDAATAMKTALDAAEA